MSKDEAVAGALKRLLATSYTVYLKTQGFHWNVTGPQFAALHAFFQTVYEELALANDVIAERIRALGQFAPSSFSEMAELTAAQSTTGVPSATNMVKELAEDMKILADVSREVVRAAADAVDDASEDLGIQRLQVAEKTAWMLRAQLG